MQRTRTRLIAWSAIGVLICGLLPAAAATADSAVPTAAPTPVSTTTPSPEPEPDPEPEPEPTESPAPTETASPDPTESPTPTPTPPPPDTDAPAPSPSPTDEPDEDEHNDGPTLPLTRELITTRALTSPGPQPVFRLPFAAGQRWGASGSHSDSDGIHRGAIDLAPLSSSDKRVLSVAAGRVYRITCATGWFLGVDHGGGWLSEYYHLTSAQSGLIGNWVEAGTYLGTAGQTLPCGGTPGSTPHVHLSILNTLTTVPDGKRQYVAVNGIQLDRYTLHDTTGAYNGTWRDLAGRTVLTSRGVTCCLTATGPSPQPSGWASGLPDTDGNGIDDFSEVIAWDTDVNADGRPDIVGFGARGVYVAHGTGSGFGAVRQSAATFGTADGWSRASHPRMLADVTGDGRPDVVGFSNAGVDVATGDGTTFTAPRRWLSDFGKNAGGWVLGKHLRTLADVTGDGRADIVAFGDAGVYVSRSTGSSFAPPTLWLREMGSSQGGWTAARHPRFVVDVDRDGHLDLVGFGDAGVYVALGTGSSFAQPRLWLANFGTVHSWRTNTHPRHILDVNGDGRPDVVGFGDAGVYVAVNTGSSFSAPTLWSTTFGAKAGGWVMNRHPRTLADVTGDGLPDVVGFGNAGVYVAANAGGRFATSVRRSTDFSALMWPMDRAPRSLVDVNGDGRADIVGFAADGVHVATSNGTQFTAPVNRLRNFGSGSTAGGWSVASHPRGISSGD